jgi:uncharacterized RDD family membrane protein YckC
MADWQPLSAVQPVLLTSAPPEGFCTECGRQFAPADLVSFGAARVCAGCKDVFFQRVREQGVAATGPVLRRFGGFWIRFLGRFIDGLILSVVFVALFLVWGLFNRQAFIRGRPPDPADMPVFFLGLGVIYVIFLAVSVFYEAWFLANRGATPGKLVLGLRVVRSNGNALTFGRGIGRALAYVLNGFIPFAIGFIIAGFDSEKRALHDHLCDTRVIYKPA